MHTDADRSGSPPAHAAKAIAVRKRRAWIASLAITCALLVVLSYMVDTHALARMCASLDVRWFTAALGWATLALVLRAIRLRLLLRSAGGPRQTFGKYFRATCLHQSLFMILPSGAGDLSMPVLARTYLQRDASHAVAALLVMRLQDAASLLAIGVPCMILWFAMPQAAALALITGVLAIGIVVAIQGAATSSAGWFRKRLVAKSRSTVSWMAKLTDHIDALLQRLSDQGLAPGAAYAAASALLSWLAVAACIDASFRTFGVAVPLTSIGVILLALNLIGAAAILTIAGLGIVEAGLSGVLILLHVVPQDTLVLAVAVRAVLLISNVGLPLVIEAAASIEQISRFSSRPRS